MSWEPILSMQMSITQDIHGSLDKSSMDKLLRALPHSKGT